MLVLSIWLWLCGCGCVVVWLYYQVVVRLIFDILQVVVLERQQGYVNCVWDKCAMEYELKYDRSV